VGISEAAHVDGQLLVGAVTGTQTSLMAISDDLQKYRELALVDGSLLGTTPIMHVHNTRVAATGGASNPWVVALDGSGIGATKMCISTL
jgi:hypothetical protein